MFIGNAAPTKIAPLEKLRPFYLFIAKKKVVGAANRKITTAAFAI
jgi:hypothetical protein